MCLRGYASQNGTALMRRQEMTTTQNEARFVFDRNWYAQCSEIHFLPL